MKVENVLEYTDGEIAFSPHYRMVLASSVRRLSPIASLVLIRIAEAANAAHGGASWYSQATIATEICHTREAVNKAFQELYARNLISRSMGDMHIFRTAEKLPKSKSCKVYLNLQELKRQTDPVIGEQAGMDYKAQVKAKQQRRQAHRNRTSYHDLKQGQDRHQGTDAAQVQEEENISTRQLEELPPLAAEALHSPESAPPDPVKLPDIAYKQSTEELHPWHSSDNPEQERARQLAELAARYPSE